MAAATATSLKVTITLKSIPNGTCSARHVVASPAPPRAMPVLHHLIRVSNECRNSLVALTVKIETRLAAVLTLINEFF
jgi:hypothetical protein